MGIIIGLALGTFSLILAYLLTAVFYGFGWAIKKMFFGLWWIIKKLFLGLVWIIDKIFSGLCLAIKKLFSTKPMKYLAHKLFVLLRFIKSSCTYIWSNLVIFWSCLIR